MDDKEFMEEMDNPTNIRVVIPKPLCNIKEKWENTAFEISDDVGGWESFSFFLPNGLY